MKKSLAIVVVLAMAASANAAVTTTFEEVLPAQDIGGTTYRIWNMMADVGSDWTNARLDLILTSGTLYQDGDGSDLHPNPGFFGFVPSLEWDTFLSVPGGYPAPVGFAGDPPYMSDTSITASWFDSVVGTAGVYKIAQISLSSDAAGTITGKVYDVDNAGVGVPLPAELYIEGGAIVPEPATLALLAIGGIGALLRKRR
jgi:hypothetical protein